MAANERKMCHRQRGNTSGTKDTNAQVPGPQTRIRDIIGTAAVWGLRHAYRPEYSVGPIHVRKADSSVESMPGNEHDSGMGPKRGTGRPHGLARWPENIPDGRHPVWAVPGKDWLVLLPNTVESMEVGPQEEVEEPMEVDPPRPRQTWDYPSRSLLCVIREHQKLCSRAWQAHYSLSLRLHPKN